MAIPREGQTSRRHREGPGAGWLIPLSLLLGVLVFFLAFPYPGSRKWDGWMAASVIAHWAECDWAEIFFFAHPLNMLITRTFDALLPVDDAMLVATIREVAFSAANAVLIYILFTAILRSRFGGVLASLAFTLPFEHWRLATRAEEKDTMLFFLLLVVLLFFHLRGWITLRALERFGRRTLAALLGVALALSFAVHLQNGLLVPFVLVATLGSSDFKANWRRDSRELLIVYAVAGLLAGTFYATVAWFAIGVRDLDGFAAWILEYHLSGQFLDADYTVSERVLEAYTAFRMYVLGWDLPDARMGEAMVAIGLTLWLIVRAWHAHPDLCKASVVFLVLLGFHFFNYRQESEPWAGASVAGLTILALASFRLDRPVGRQRGLAVWMALLAAMLAVNVGTYRRRSERVWPLYEHNLADYPASQGPLARHFQAHLPDAQIALRVDALVEPDAIILVEPRHAVNAFRVYTGRRPIVARYLDRDESYFGSPDVALTVLSRHFYIPPFASAEILEQARQGRPLYYLTNDERPGPRLRGQFRGGWHQVDDFDYRDRRLLRWQPGDTGEET